MALKIVEIQVPAHTREGLDAVVCDCCKRENKVPVDQDGADEWSDDPYHSDKIRIQRDKGDAYPEGSWIKMTCWDLCPECWDKHLAPFMEKLCGKPRTVDLGW